MSQAFFRFYSIERAKAVNVGFQQKDELRVVRRLSD